MSVRNGSSLNVVRLNSRLAPSGVMTMTLTYKGVAANGRVEYEDPVKVEVIFTRPDGTQMRGEFPEPEGGNEGIAIGKTAEGRYYVNVPLGTYYGRWKYQVITNDGFGPGEDGEFEVVAAS